MVAAVAEVALKTATAIYIVGLNVGCCWEPASLHACLHACMSDAVRKFRQCKGRLLLDQDIANLFMWMVSDGLYVNSYCLNYITDHRLEWPVPG
jgi:hypothetical protein